MTDEDLKPGIRRALRLHEIGNDTPYRLYFAGKGKSGASFGFMQGDLAARQPAAQRAFRDAMQAAGIAADKIDEWLAQLSVHLIANPLSREDTDLVNGALASEAGRARVDAMDEEILAGVYRGLDQCLDAAQRAQRRIAAKAQIYMALWINMTGPPTRLLRWLGGEAVTMTQPVAPPGPTIEPEDMETYLRASDYFTENPRNFQHMADCAAAGSEATTAIA